VPPGNVGRVTFVVLAIVVLFSVETVRVERTWIEPMDDLQLAQPWRSAVDIERDCGLSSEPTLEFLKRDEYLATFADDAQLG